jgi:hypothetical protein
MDHMGMIGGHQLGNRASKNNRFRVDGTMNRPSGPLRPSVHVSRMGE